MLSIFIVSENESSALSLASNIINNTNYKIGNIIDIYQNGELFEYNIEILTID